MIYSNTKLAIYPIIIQLPNSYMENLLNWKMYRMKNGQSQNSPSFEKLVLLWQKKWVVIPLPKKL